MVKLPFLKNKKLCHIGCALYIINNILAMFNYAFLIKSHVYKMVVLTLDDFAMYQSILRLMKLQLIVIN